MRKRYTPPPTPVYNIGKRKERCTKAINLLRLLLSDSPGHKGLMAAIQDIEAYREKLNDV